MTYSIGIDGGGTHTRIVLAGNDGSVHGYAVSGPANPNTVPKLEIKMTLTYLFAVLKKQAKQEFRNVTAVFAGVAGTSNHVGRQIISSILKEIAPPKAAITVEIDAVNALYSGTFGQKGIVQIAGTGAVTYGINSKNQELRSGGWGYLFGDEGSGYYIGRSAVIAVLRAWDGRGRNTVLTEKLFDHFQVKSAAGLTDHIYHAPSPKSEIADLSRLVFQAYKQNDATAETIMTAAANEMCLHIVSLYQRLFDQNEKVPVIMCGGVFSDPSIMPVILKRKLSEQNPNLEPVLPEMSPAGGAIIGAQLKKGLPVSLEFRKRLITGLKRHQTNFQIDRKNGQS